MKTPLTRSLMILLAVALAAPLALAHDVDVVGVWDAVAETPEGDMPSVMTIAKKDDALEITLNMGGYDREVTDVKLDGHTLEMTVTYEGAPTTSSSRSTATPWRAPTPEWPRPAR